MFNDVNYNYNNNNEGGSPSQVENTTLLEMLKEEELVQKINEQIGHPGSDYQKVDNDNFQNHLQSLGCSNVKRRRSESGEPPKPTFLESLMDRARKGGEVRMKLEHEKRMKLEREKRMKLYSGLMRQLSRAWQDLMTKNMKDVVNLNGYRPPCTCGEDSHAEFVLCHTSDGLIYIREIKCGTCCTRPRLILELTPNGELAKRDDPVYRDVLERILYDWNIKDKRF